LQAESIILAQFLDKHALIAQVSPRIPKGLGSEFFFSGISFGIPNTSNIVRHSFIQDAVTKGVNN
jgi:hypothetical protein